jgi:predicted RNA-binding protein with RPS1 domain
MTLIEDFVSLFVVFVVVFLTALFDPNIAVHHVFLVNKDGVKTHGDGMVHISQIQDQRLEDIHLALKEGQEVWVKVIDVFPDPKNPARQKVSLSMKVCGQRNGPDLAVLLRSFRTCSESSQYSRSQTRYLFRKYTCFSSVGMDMDPSNSQIPDKKRNAGFVSLFRNLYNGLSAFTTNCGDVSSQHHFSVLQGGGKALLGMGGNHPTPSVQNLTQYTRCALFSL